MNLEHLCKTITTRWEEIPDKKRALRYVRYQFELLAWKRQKLKLGAIAFDVKEFKFDEIVLWEEIEIRYTRQDTSVDDEQKLENILKRLGWQWDVKNFIALGVVIFGALLYSYVVLKGLYQKHLPTLAFREFHYDYLLKYSFQATFAPGSVGIFKKLSDLNFWLVDVFTDFCTYFNIIF
jgi:hypothetical protein